MRGGMSGTTNGLQWTLIFGKWREGVRGEGLGTPAPAAIPPNPLSHSCSFVSLRGATFQERQAVCLLVPSPIPAAQAGRRE